MVTAFEIFFTHRFQVSDPAGNVVGWFIRPRKFIRSQVELYGAAGTYIGRIVQENFFFHIHFALEDAYGHRVGELRAGNWRAWDFTFTDAAGTPVATMTKTWEGWARTFLTTADRYVVAIHRPLADPLRTLVVAGALAVDVALKQDSRGLNALGG